MESLTDLTLKKLEERKGQDTQFHSGRAWLSNMHQLPSLHELRNEDILPLMFLRNSFWKEKEIQKKVALGKKEMKVVKCNTRKVLLTRNRSLIPPALSLQLQPPFLKIHFSS